MVDSSGTGQPVSSPDTSSNYLRALISLLNPGNTTAPPVSSGPAWVLANQISNQGSTPDMGASWGNTTFGSFGKPSPQQDLDIPWNFDIS